MWQIPGTGGQPSSLGHLELTHVQPHPLAPPTSRNAGCSLSHLLQFSSFLFRTASWHSPYLLSEEGPSFLQVPTDSKCVLLMTRIRFHMGGTLYPLKLAREGNAVWILRSYKDWQPERNSSVPSHFLTQRKREGKWLANQCSRNEVEAPALDCVTPRWPGSACRRKGYSLLGSLSLETMALPV